MVNDRTIYILGGGVSGLSLAYELQKKGQQVEIIEKSSNIGGLAKTLKWKDHFVDMGPHIYHTPDKDIENYWKKEFTNLFHEREHWSKNMKNGELFDYPISKEFIESLPSDTQDKINSELKNINPEDLANAILQLLMDDIKLTKMGANGRKHALKFYKDTDVVKQHYTLYRKHFI